MTATIKRIDAASVHRLTSDQVIIDLSSAAKELLENSLDANATTIEIKFKDQGATYLEVIDDGDGIAVADRPHVCAKYHTSKLSSFDALSEIRSYGFRGEALSSLCGTSTVTITTATAADKGVGVKLSFDAHGRITSEEPAPRAKGTSIRVERMFQTTPVRQKLFIKTIKRQYAKCIDLLQAYALVLPSHRLIVTNLDNKVRPIVTIGSGDLMQNFGQVFGIKAAQHLLRLPEDIEHVIMPEEAGDSRPVYPLKYLLSLFIANVHGHLKPSRLRGLVSSPELGKGRGGGDRQFVYINSRPADVPKVSKLFNEVYKSFNATQYPIFVCDLCLPTTWCDVNLTPDKRTILLQHEDRIFLWLRSVLEKTFSPFQHTFNMVESSIHTYLQKRQEPPPPKLPVVQQSRVEEVEDPPQGLVEEVAPGIEEKRARTESNAASRSSPPTRISEEASREEEPVRELQAPVHRENLWLQNGAANVLTNVLHDASSRPTKRLVEPDLSRERVTAKVPRITSFLSSVTSPAPISTNVAPLPAASPKSSCCSSDHHDGKEADQEDDDEEEEDLVLPEQDVTAPSVPPSMVPRRYCSFEVDDLHRQKVQVQFHVPLKERSKLPAMRPAALLSTRDSEKGSQSTLQGAKIDADFANAEKTLSRCIHKADFEKMHILGQFNLGFIIVKLGGDLFIIDQHASDEIFNFERLQESEILTGLPMVRPMPLHLSPTHQHLLVAQKSVLEANGFFVDVKETGGFFESATLVKVPNSNKSTLGLQDFEELLSILEDHPVKMARPSKVRAIFASRACRKSVMIGTSLSKTKMMEIVRHMGMIDKPWNCPHGRPTMRYLYRLRKTTRT